MDGVVVSFPTGVNYVLNDVFVIQATAIPNAGTPFYELWPHQQAQHVYPYLYEQVPPDLNDPSAAIPRYIPSNFLVDMALEDLSLWPGVSADKLNPYASLRNAEYYRQRNMKQIQQLEVQDDNVYVQDISYAYPAISWAYATPIGDSAWLQRHAV